jgi:hypothetical protein
MLRRSLSTLPPTLDQTYDRILSSISEEDTEYAIRILQWLTFSARPLSVKEVAEAVAINVERDPAFDHNEVLEDPREVLNICSSLVTIADPKQQTIALAHYSVREYLVSDRIKQGQAKQYSMQEAECHSAITKGCLNYILQLPQPFSERDLRISALARYSAKFWTSHLRKTENEMKVVSRLAMSLMSIEKPAYLTWIQLYDPEKPWKKPDLDRGLGSIVSPLYYAALLDLNTIVKFLLDNNANVNAQGGEYGNVLQAASIKGNTQMVKLLLDNNANVNAQGGEYGNALQAASIKGNTQIVKLLLDNNANVNAQGGEYGNALQAASVAGHEQIVKLLLNAGADLNTQDGLYSSTLQAATEEKYGPITKPLLEFTRANAKLRIVKTDSGYASASQRYGDSLYAQSVQGPGFQQTLGPEEAARIQVPSPYETEVFLDDIRSVESDHESIGSKVSTSRSKAELYAVNRLASFFAQLEDLRPLHELALQKVKREKFTRNYRRILKSYYGWLLHEANNDIEREVTKILRFKRNRKSIAEGIANHLEHVEDEEPRFLAELRAQPHEEIYLDNWLEETFDGRPWGPDQEHVVDQEFVGEDYHLESTDIDSELDTDSRADLVNIDRAKRFLQQGPAFRNLVLAIHLWVLPDHLSEIVETTPKHWLQILLQNETGWVNRMKAYLETYTGLEWDWWPLAPRIPSMGIKERCLQWQVRCLFLCNNHLLLC